jgi:uncharacterized protein (UPF0147 family)
VPGSPDRDPAAGFAKENDAAKKLGTARAATAVRSMLWDVSNDPESPCRPPSQTWENG